jgi:cytochrome c peroxidase
MFGEKLVEMGTLGHETPVLRHIEANSVYVKLFKTAFAEQAGKISFETIGMAIAAFQRTLASGRSAYDSFASGKMSAMSAAARRDLKLFISARMKCNQCHLPPFFTNATRQPKFHNTGLYNVDGVGGFPGPDQGLSSETGKRLDICKFRTPTHGFKRHFADWTVDDLYMLGPPSKPKRCLILANNRSRSSR